ncbi:hypothetical protein Nepgr_029599 [Nepenthes gracilis]|uniref:Polygalacturonase QRT3 n=1 Tax=Nepenthes gracilis TaxID=150966 RepID=A0AAD3TF79_NEPGR|nr:hypothetical protein Nepgr_029599 [Nepenthes gracilis]
MGVMLAFGFLLLLLFTEDAHSSILQRRRRQLRAFQSKLQHKFTPSQNDAPVPKTEGRVIYPIGYGADPTGAADSSDAILEAVADAFRVQKGLQLLPSVNDLGGVTIDFQGGNFNVSKPISFPPQGGGNLLVKGGSLRASAEFPGDRHLIELPSSQSGSIIFEDITFRDMLFDSGYRGGGLSVVNSARIRINNCYFLHFTTEGILVQGGHETFVSESFLGQHETVGGDPAEKTFSGTGIDLASNDNAVTDVAIFSAATGIILRGQANIITGVHCYNKATYFGGIGILVKLPGNSQTRIDNCYLDYNSILIEDPVQVHITNGFFLGGGNVVLKSIKGQVSGLNIVNNMFSGDPKNMRPIVELDGAFGSRDQVVVDHNDVVGMAVKSTVGRLTVAGNGTKWVADFSPVLLFPNQISHLQYGFYDRGGGAAKAGGGFAAHAVTSVANNAVTVEADRVVDGVVSVVVDQHNRAGELGF